MTDLLKDLGFVLGKGTRSPGEANLVHAEASSLWASEEPHPQSRPEIFRHATAAHNRCP